MPPAELACLRRVSLQERTHKVMSTLVHTQGNLVAPAAKGGSHPLRLSFLINSMEGGGAERAMANLLGHLESPLAGCDVELVLLDDVEIKQVLPDWVRVVTLDGGGSLLRSSVKVVKYVMRRRPDVMVSYLARANCLNVVTRLCGGHRAIISERVQTSSHLSTSRARKIFEVMTKLTYPRAHKVIAVSQGVADDLADNFGVPRDRLTVIGNPIDAAALSRAASEPPAVALPEDYILAVGRMVPNKNFRMLLTGYAKAAPEPDLVILGDGPLRGELVALVEELGLKGRVHMPGFVDNPYPVMRGAQWLVSCSNAEGFPNTIIEALSLGTAVIATDCPAGPAEVLRGHADPDSPVTKNAQDGLLIPMEDPDRLAEAMAVFGDADRRADYAARAKARSTAFGVDSVVQAYVDLIFAGQSVPAPHKGSIA